ncbi:MAG: hypothetical protein HY659_12250 [Rhizobiales bacterium]|nr:hypothetical protein [Hyphomicrobiales bacterium]
MSGLLKLASSLRRGCATTALRLAVAVTAIVFFSFLTTGESYAFAPTQMGVATVNYETAQKGNNLSTEVTVTLSGKVSVSNAATTTSLHVPGPKCCGSDQCSGTCAAGGYCAAFSVAIMTGNAMFAIDVINDTHGWPSEITLALNQPNPDFKPPRIFS